MLHGTKKTIAVGNRTYLASASGSEFSNTAFPDGSVIMWGNNSSAGGYVYASKEVSVYGGGSSDMMTDTSVTMTGGAVEYVYGGNCSGTLTGNTSATISGGTVSDSVYGDGKNGVLTGNTSVTISGGTTGGLAADGVKIDGVVVDPSNYTTSVSSFVVEFNGSYLNPLSLGRHEIAVTLGGRYSGTYRSTITVRGVPSSSGRTNPSTGVKLAWLSCSGQ